MMVVDAHVMEQVAHGNNIRTFEAGNFFAGIS